MQDSTRRRGDNGGNIGNELWGGRESLPASEKKVKY